MENIFELQERKKLGKKEAKKIRKDSLVPGVIYGDKIENRYFIIDPRQIDKMKQHSQRMALIDVKISSEKEPVKVVIEDVQKNPVKDLYEHIDLYQVRMDKKLSAELSLEFVGESAAVKDFGGILVKQYDKIAIECLPKDLINSLEVSIESLKTFDDVIRIKELNLPEHVETHIDPEEIVVSVSEPRTEEELEELESDIKTDVEDVEVTSEKKEEESDESSEDDNKEDQEKQE